LAQLIARHGPGIAGLIEQKRAQYEQAVHPPVFSPTVVHENRSST